MQPKLIKAGLPTGQVWYATAEGHHTAWRTWRQLVRRCLETGEGLETTIEGEDVVFATVYSHLHHGARVGVTHTGEVYAAAHSEVALCEAVDPKPEARLACADRGAPLSAK